MTMQSWNNNLDIGGCILSYSHGLDKIKVFLVPDINVGFYEGWVFLINSQPYYWSVAGGSEQLSTGICECYLTYQKEVLKENLDDEEVGFEFETDFICAMEDAGHKMEDDGSWTYFARKHKPAKKAVKKTTKKATKKTVKKKEGRGRK